MNWISDVLFWVPSALLGLLIWALVMRWCCFHKYEVVEKTYTDPVSCKDQPLGEKDLMLLTGYVTVFSKCTKCGKLSTNCLSGRSIGDTRGQLVLKQLNEAEEHVP